MKDTQQNKILNLLREFGSVNSHDLTYIYGIKQAPTRIKELRLQGYTITSSKLLPNRSVNYILLKTPPVPRFGQEYKSEEEELIPVKKNDYIFYERKKDLEPKQLELLTE